MITRVWECDVTSDGLDGLTTFLAHHDWAGALVRPGFRGGSVYRSHDASKQHIYVVTHWRDEESIAGHVGSDWPNFPLVDPGEEPFMVGKPSVSHYVRLAVAP